MFYLFWNFLSRESVYGLGRRALKNIKDDLTHITYKEVNVLEKCEQIHKILFCTMFKGDTLV